MSSSSRGRRRGGGARNGVKWLSAAPEPTIEASVYQQSTQGRITKSTKDHQMFEPPTAGNSHTSKTLVDNTASYVDILAGLFEPTPAPDPALTSTGKRKRKRKNVSVSRNLYYVLSLITDREYSNLSKTGWNGDKRSTSLKFFADTAGGDNNQVTRVPCAYVLALQVRWQSSNARIALVLASFAPTVLCKRTRITRVIVFM
jgi:hypothetical protein